MESSLVDFLGDCPVVNDFLTSKEVFGKWFFVHYLNAFLRAVGQVIFVNNPLCGLVALFSLFFQDPQVGLGAVLGGSIAVIGDLLLQVAPYDVIQNGLSGFCGVLVGCVNVALFPKEDASLTMWVLIAFGSLASIYVCRALANLLSGVGVPHLTFPFNMVIICSFLAVQANSNSTQGVVDDPEENGTEIILLSSEVDIDWLQVGRGVLVSQSQVFAVNHISTSIVMNVAVAAFSPLLFVTGNLGAVIGCFTGALLLPAEDLHEVYAGVCGYCPLLTMGALSCVFNVTTPHSFVLAVVATFATVLAQFALRANMLFQNNLGVFTLPFALVTLLFLLITDQNGTLQRVTEPSFPEKQTFQWFNKQRKEEAQSREEDQTQV